MKTLTKLALLLGLVTVGNWEVCAQIRDDESSTNYLAMQCAVSGGGVSGNYTEYCRKLAKTIGFLAPEQQKRVFGFIPQPVEFARPEDDESSGKVFDNGVANSDSGAEAIGNADGNVGGSVNHGSGEISSGEMPANSEDLDTQPANSDPSVEEEAIPENVDSGYWQDILAWFEGVYEAAVEAMAERQK